MKLLESRDVGAIVEYVRELMEHPDFAHLKLEWANEGKIQSAVLDAGEVADLLLDELTARLDELGVLDVTEDFYTIEQQLKDLFGEDVSGIYIKTVMPTGFIGVVRQTQTRGDSGRLSEKLVDQYKHELIKVDKGLQNIRHVLQQHSNFPVEHVQALSGLVERLYQKAKSDYKFIATKPYFQKVLDAAEVASGDNRDKDKDRDSFLFFNDYQDGSLEPQISRQIQCRLALDALLIQLAKRGILSENKYNESAGVVRKLWEHQPGKTLTLQLRKILEETFKDLSRDRDAILNKLSHTFLDEYHCAEKLMVMRHQMICRELAYTNEYLKRINSKSEKIAETNLDKVRVAQEKTERLTGIFSINEALRENATQTPTLELERTALGLSTSVSPEQLTEWIRIYSILFSNSDLMAGTDEPVDFSVMRRQISNLCTFHLTLSVAELKAAVERGLEGAEEEKSNKFKRFNDALKYRLQGLIHKKEEKEKSLTQMIQELEFLDDQSIQFVIADTFAGFKLIADAFLATENEYFVKNRAALMEESRKLYNQICEQCLKHFVYKPSRAVKSVEPDKAQEKKNWYKRLFSS